MDAMREVNRNRTDNAGDNTMTREEQIQAIMECGFTRDQATFALNSTNGGVDEAISFLLDNANN